MTDVITVVGLGKIGLPLAVQFASAGRKVIGFDVSLATVALVNRGEVPFPNEAHLPELLAEVVRSGMLYATTDSKEAISNASEVVIVVPLYVDTNGIPDFSAIDLATADVARSLRTGTLVCYETTVPVGTTRERFKVNLEHISGLRCGFDFNLAFSPERVSSGRVLADLRRYPKIVGGITHKCGNRAADFYSSVLQFDQRQDLTKPNGVWNLGSCEASELAKLAETTYRDVNIGLANQFAMFAEKIGVDILSVIEACNSQPYSHIHEPGIAVGGHCIPVYPQMYLWNDPEASIVRAARLTNNLMPEHYVALLEREHGALRNETVLILGAAYRGGVKETAFSGIFPIVDALQARGAHCYVTDPLYTAEEIESLGLPSRGNSFAVNAIVIHTDHSDYNNHDFTQYPKLRTILNGRSSIKVFPPKLVKVVGNS